MVLYLFLVFLSLLNFNGGASVFRGVLQEQRLVNFVL